MRSRITIIGLIFSFIQLFAVVTGTNAAEKFTIDPVHSSVVFKVRHIGVSNFYGRFNVIEGSFTIDENDIGKSSLEVTIPVESIDTHDAKRDGHLKSPDFFNAKTFPVIRFVGKKFAKVSEQVIEVSGDLTLHGVTKPISFRMIHIGSGKDPWGGFRTGYEGELVLRRSEFGMKFMLDGVGDEVTIFLGIEATRE